MRKWLANTFLALKKAQTEILRERVNRGPSNHAISIRDELAGPFAALALISDPHTQINNCEWAARKAASRSSVA